MIRTLLLTLTPLLTPQDETVARWTAALEVGEVAVVLSEGPPLVTGGGALAGDALAVTTVARALHDAGREPLAWSLLDGFRVARGARAQEAARAAVLLDVTRAALWLAEDRLKEAIESLAPRGLDAPRHAQEPEAWLLLGRALARNGNLAQAEPLLLEFLDRAPRHPGAPAAWYVLAQAALARRDGTTAAQRRARGEELRRWLALLRARRVQVSEDPAAPLPRLGLAQLWLEAGDLERAEATLLTLTELSPEYARGWSHLAEVRRRQGDDRRARALFEQALDLDPANSWSALRLAQLDLAEGQRAAGLQRLEELVARAPSEPRDRSVLEALQTLAQALEESDLERSKALRAEYVRLGGGS